MLGTLLILKFLLKTFIKFPEKYNLKKILVLWKDNENPDIGTFYKHIVFNLNNYLITISIFASQGLRSTPLLSTLGRLSQNFVIPVYRPLADLWSSAHLHYIIINQWERLYYYLFEGM